jgi:hypothetical protein
MAHSVSIDALRPELWQKELIKNVQDQNFFSRFMGTDANNIIQIKNDLKKKHNTGPPVVTRYVTLRDYAILHFSIKA